jgi:stage II sporulation protein AA (anti-sigma F factor antagonist)
VESSFLDEVGFRLDVQSNTSAIIVYLYGELDAMAANVLSDELPNLIRRDDDRTVTFDFANLRFIDASGLGILGTANTALGANGRHLAIRNHSDFVMKLFRITGLSRVLRLEEI